MVLFALDQNGVIVLWNDENGGIALENGQSICGQSIGRLCANNSTATNFFRIALSGRFVCADLTFLGRQGRFCLTPVEHGMASEVGCIGVFTYADTEEYFPTLKTSRDQQELVQREETGEEKFNEILEHISDGFFALDREWRYTYVNRNFEKLIRFSREEILGRSIWSVFPDTVESALYNELHSAMRNQETAVFEYFYPSYEGWYSIRAYPTPHGISAFFQDITARKRSELLRRDLLLRLTTVQEDERVRLSRELHDQLGQDLTALLLGLRSLPQRSRGTDMAVRIDELQGIVHHLIQQTRHVVLDLRAEPLNAQGLEVALRQYVEDWSQYHGLKVDFHSRGFEGHRAALYIEATIYRVVQEALTNVLRHASANLVSVLLEYRQEYILAIVEDNGHGFDVAKVQNQSETVRGWGLRGMRERVELVNGSLHFESSPEAGTTIFLRVPHDEQRKIVLK